MSAIWAVLLAAAAARAAAATPPSPGAPPLPKPVFTVPLSWETVDFQYYLEAGIGAEDAAPFRLLLDTGSANVWVPSASCASLACGGRARLDPSAPGAFQARARESGAGGCRAGRAAAVPSCARRAACPQSPTPPRNPPTPPLLRRAAAAQRCSSRTATWA